MVLHPLNRVWSLTIPELVEVSNSICMGYPIPSRSMELQAASIGLLCLVIFFVGLRLLSRYIMGRGLWWDDWTLQIAIVSIFFWFPLHLDQHV